MASIQDIHALEERIYDAVQEYLDNPEGYTNATLHVYLDEDKMEYRAEMEDNLQGTEDDGIYPIEDLMFPKCQTSDKSTPNFQTSEKLTWSHICELMVEYATYGMDSNLFVSKYELFLPNKDELRKMVRGMLKK